MIAEKLERTGVTPADIKKHPLAKCNPSRAAATFLGTKQGSVGIPFAVM